MFSRHLIQQGHTRQFDIHVAEDGGWEVREAADRHVVRLVRLSDWHRVERARTAFALRVLSLQREGWVDAGPGEAPDVSQAETAVRTRTAGGGHSTKR
jgi:hypothetical protein